MENVGAGKPSTSKETERQAHLQSSEKTERHRNQRLGDQNIRFTTYEKEKREGDRRKGKWEDVASNL